MSPKQSDGNDKIANGLQGLNKLLGHRTRLGICVLLARNDRRAASAGAAWLEGIAHSAGVALARVEPAPPGPDFPGLASFPEGDPFRGWLLSQG